MLQNQLPFNIPIDSDQDSWTNPSSIVNPLYTNETSELYNISKINEDEKSSEFLSLELKNSKNKIELLTLNKESLEALDESETIKRKISEINENIEKENKLQKILSDQLAKNLKLKNIFNNDIVIPKLGETEKSKINWDLVFRSISPNNNDDSKENFKNTWYSIINLAKFNEYSYNQLDNILKTVLRGQILEFYCGLEGEDITKKLEILLKAYLPQNNFITKKIKF